MVVTGMVKERCSRCEWVMEVALDVRGLMYVPTRGTCGLGRCCPICGASELGWVVLEGDDYEKKTG